MLSFVLRSSSSSASEASRFINLIPIPLFIDDGFTIHKLLLGSEVRRNQKASQSSGRTRVKDKKAHSSPLPSFSASTAFLLTACQSWSFLLSMIRLGKGFVETRACRR